MTHTLSQTSLVPYIVTWSGEQHIKRRLIQGKRGIAFADELPHDRDSGGALWHRCALRRGQGRPRPGVVHPQRQRRAMRSLLCQVCAGPADSDERGVLYLTEDHRGDWPDWPERLMTTHPPLCLPCAAKAVRYCPHLLSGHVALRSTASEICAVHGRRYYPGPLLHFPGDKEIVQYDDPAIGWVLAWQLVRSLSGCTIVDLDAELAAATP